MAPPSTEWDPGTYGRFRGLRLRPALDLLMQVGALPDGDVVDVGCGDGAAAGALRARFPDRRLIGVDSSASMLEKAKGFDSKALVDVAVWTPDAVPALIFSNAVLQWLPHHAALMPRLAGLLPAHGVLAIQMPRQLSAPSHRLLRSVASEMFPDRFAAESPLASVREPAFYHRLLSPLGEVSVWETEYLQQLAPDAEGHPVRHFTRSTGMRPYADQMTPEELDRYIAAYDEALAAAYPAESDGSVLFPFRRLFIVLTKG